MTKVPINLTRRSIAIAGALGGLALVLRLLAARGDLWLDEIWSLDNVRALGSALDVFTSLHTDNNHYLTSLYLMLLGDASSSLAYRLPSILAGGVATSLAALPPLTRTPREAWIAGLLFAVSPLLVQYDSEARGYALAVACALISFRLLVRQLAAPDWPTALSFGGITTLGLLSHLTFLYPLLGFAAWAGWVAYRRWQVDAETLVAFVLPAVALFLLWLVDLRELVVAGGNVETYSNVVGELLQALLGLPLGISLCILTLGAATLGIEGERPESDGSWVFFAVTLFVAPALILAWSRPAYLAPRYFVTAAPFALVLLSRSLAHLAELGRNGRRLVLAVLVTVVAGSLSRDTELIRLGRGDYAAATRYLAEHTTGPTVRMTSDHDFRNGKVVAWYERRLGGTKPYEYQSGSEYRSRPAEWYLMHDAPDGGPPAQLTPASGGQYRLEQQYRHAGLSGWDWEVYRLENSSPRDGGT